MSFVDTLLANLRDNGIIYLVCIVAIIGSFKFLADSPKQRMFTLIGCALIGLSKFGGMLVMVIAAEVMLDSPKAVTNVRDFETARKQMESYGKQVETFQTISKVVSFLIGAMLAAGIASLVWAVFVDKIRVSAKKVKKSKRRRVVEEEDDDEEEEEEERPRKKRRPRDDDE